MKIISWNLLHTTGATIDQVAQLIDQHAPDVFLMQEATARMDALPKQRGGHYARVALPGRQHGLAGWSRTPFHGDAMSLTLQRGVVVRRVCQILSFQNIALANVHLSHGQLLNRVQLRQIATALPARAAILGDCNMVGAPLLPGFADVGPRAPTHRAARLLPLRLDRCFIRNAICDSCEALGRGPSDHRPIMVTLS